MTEKHALSEVLIPDGPLRIEEIHVVWADDGGILPDFLGEFSNEPKPGAIDREALGERRIHEFRYFNPGNPEYAMDDYRRYEAFNDGLWSLEGCIARAIVSYPIGERIRRLQIFDSSGVWGIESDSSEDYKLEIEIEQLDELKHHVQVFNVPWSAREETIISKTTLRLEEIRSRKNAEKGQQTSTPRSK